MTSYDFWRHRDPIAPKIRTKSESCFCCYCIYSLNPHQTDSSTPRISPNINAVKNRLPYSRRIDLIPQPLFSVTSYAGQSIAGSNDSYASKTNQDSLVMLEDVRTHSLVLACLDGHGIHGHIISQFFKYGLETRLLSHELWASNPKGAICMLLEELEEEVCQYPQVESEFSGTTLVLAVVRDSNLLVANIGDSRAVLGSSLRLRKDSSEDDDEEEDEGEIEGQGVLELESVPLTTDHKPEVPRELSRILMAGGRVFALGVEGPGGSQRVWLNDEDLPGLAMSRSLGDKVAHSIGVISTPEFIERQIDNERDCLLVLGTDGLWDHLSNDEVIQMMAAKKDATPGQYVVTLIEEAKRRWASAGGGQDDITACVATLLGRKRQKVS